MDAVVGEIHAIQRRARMDGDLSRPTWPVIVLKTPKGWTGPREVDGLPVEGTWRAHQVPVAEARTNPDHLAQLEAWLRAYRPEELFGSSGALVEEVARLAPRDWRRMSANPHANGGLLLRELRLPDFTDYAVDVPAPGARESEPTRVLGDWLRDVIKGNPSNFRLFGPDETESNRLGNVYQVTGKAFAGEIVPGDNHLAPDGRVMEILSEHLCQGWLAGDLLTGRHGHSNLHVRGYKEEGTTTPFDMVMLNDLDRFHLVMDVIDRVPGLSSSAGHVRQLMANKRLACRAYTRTHGEDAPEIRDWTWPS